MAEKPITDNDLRIDELLSNELTCNYQWQGSADELWQRVAAKLGRQAKPWWRTRQSWAVASVATLILTVGLQYGPWLAQLMTAFAPPHPPESQPNPHEAKLPLWGLNHTPYDTGGHIKGPAPRYFYFATTVVPRVELGQVLSVAVELTNVYTQTLTVDNDISLRIWRWGEHERISEPVVERLVPTTSGTWLPGEQRTAILTVESPREGGWFVVELDIHLRNNERQTRLTGADSRIFVVDPNQPSKIGQLTLVESLVVGEQSFTVTSISFEEQQTVVNYQALNIPVPGGLEAAVQTNTGQRLAVLGHSYGASAQGVQGTVVLEPTPVNASGLVVELSNGGQLEITFPEGFGLHREYLRGN